jgi:hypothetical protein
MAALFSHGLQALLAFRRFRRRPLARYLIDELLTADNGLAGRICRHSLNACWPLIAGCFTGSRSRVGPVSA